MAEEQYGHPAVCLFTVLFKFSALAFYIVCGLFVEDFVIQFVVTVMFIALDFWTVKNALETLNKKDSWLFWWTLYLSPVAWVVLGVVSVLKFNLDYLLIVAVAVVLNLANIVGFTKCRKDAKKQLQQFATNTLASRMGNSLQSAFSV